MAPLSGVRRRTRPPLVKPGIRRRLKHIPFPPRGDRQIAVPHVGIQTRHNRSKDSRGGRRRRRPHLLVPAAPVPRKQPPKSPQSLNPLRKNSARTPARSFSKSPLSDGTKPKQLPTCCTRRDFARMLFPNPAI